MKKSDAKRSPWLFRGLLQRMSLYDINHSVLGDFEESFREIASKKGLTRARLWYAYQAMSTIADYIRLLLTTGFGLMFNYTKLTIRNLKRHKLYSLINIIGLSIGLAAATLIFIYIRFELSYDKYHPDADRTYRIVDKEFTSVPYILGEILQVQSPEIEELVRIKDKTSWGSIVLGAAGKQVMEDKLFMADPEIFRIFSYNFLKGDPDSALAAPNAIVLTEKAAQKYFGSSDPLGKMVTIREALFQVTAIISDIAANTHFHFNALVSAAAEKSIEPRSDDQASWSSSNYKTYLKLAPNSNLVLLESRINTIFSQNRKKSPELHLQPLLDIHLYSNLRSEFEANRDINNLRFAAAIGCIILLVALLNFMNLTSAHSLHRSREVGLRKVMGAQRPQLIRQFVGEAMVTISISLIFGLALAYAFLPYFGRLSGVDLGWQYIPLQTLSLFLLALTVIAGGVAGSYPALFASRFQPVKALRGEKQTASLRFPLRNIFVGIQFAVTIVFLCAALFVWSQMRFMKQLQLGSVKERIVTIELPRQARHHHHTIKTALLLSPGVTEVTSSNFLPSTNNQNIGSTWEGRVESEDIYLSKVAVDHDFISTYRIKVLAGEPFSPGHPVGETYIVNETAARLIGGGSLEEAVGKTLTMHTWDSQPGRVIGVVEDFHFRSLHRVIEPLVLFLDASRTVVRPTTGEAYKMEPFRYVSARLNMKDVGAVLGRVDELCEEFIPYAPNSWSFFDQDFDRLYSAEKRVSTFMITLAITAVILAAMGLLGLSIYSVENRRKEIGIRRVMGASTSNILFLFFKDFLRIHLWAMLCAFPIIAYTMHNWLQNFAYRISLSPMIFLIGGVFTAALFFLTSSLNVYKNASANPADSLRNE